MVSISVILQRTSWLSASLANVDFTNRSYSCLERRIKGWVSVVIAVLAANYALLGFAYTVYVFIAMHLQKPNDARASTSRH